MVNTHIYAAYIWKSLKVKKLKSFFYFISFNQIRLNKYMKKQRFGIQGTVKQKFKSKLVDLEKLLKIFLRRVTVCLKISIQ